MGDNENKLLVDLLIQYTTMFICQRSVKIIATPCTNDFLRVIHSRLYKKIEEQEDKTQFGFQNVLSTREALFILQVLVQRNRDACF